MLETAVSPYPTPRSCRPPPPPPPATPPATPPPPSLPNSPFQPAAPAPAHLEVAEDAGRAEAGVVGVEEGDVPVPGPHPVQRHGRLPQQLVPPLLARRRRHPARGPPVPDGDAEHGGVAAADLELGPAARARAQRAHKRSGRTWRRGRVWRRGSQGGWQGRQGGKGREMASNGRELIMGGAVRRRGVWAGAVGAERSGAGGGGVGGSLRAGHVRLREARGQAPPRAPRFHSAQRPLLVELSAKNWRLAPSLGRDAGNLAQLPGSGSLARSPR